MASASTIDLITRKEICIPRGAARDYTITVENVSKNAAGKIVKTRTDLTGAIVRFAVKPSRESTDSEVVFEKSSANGPTEIEILPQVIATVDQPTKGQAVIKLIGADTDSLDPTECFVYDVWVILPDGRRDAVIDESPFIVDERINPLAVQPPPVLPLGPQVFGTYERAFSAAVDQGTNTTTYNTGPPIFPGSLLGLSVLLTQPVIAGTVTITVVIAGSDAFSVVLDDTASPSKASFSQAFNINEIALLDDIDVRVDAAGYANAAAITSGLQVNLMLGT